MSGPYSSSLTGLINFNEIKGQRLVEFFVFLFLLNSCEKLAPDQTMLWPTKFSGKGTTVLTVSFIR
jgi:hypothetical protein